MSYKPVEVKVWGPYACFTRPEAKVERVSYEVPTPSACRGILEAIYWHPSMQWRIKEIVILNPIRHFSVLRNEIAAIMPRQASDEPIGIGDPKKRSQRHSLCLRDVAYIIKADVYVPGSQNQTDQVKHRDQFQRRVREGKCFHHPYAGVREFAVNFCPPDGTESPLDINIELGRMLFDVVWRERKGGPIEFMRHIDDIQNSKEIVTGYAEAIYFNAAIENGVVHIPHSLYEKSEGDS